MAGTAFITVMAFITVFHCRCNVGDGTEGEAWSCRAPTYPPSTRPSNNDGVGGRSRGGSGGRLVLFKRKPRLRSRSGTVGQSNKAKVWLLLLSLATSILCMLWF